MLSLTADEGYFGVDEVFCLQEEQVRVVIGDPHTTMCNIKKQGKVIRSVLNKARRAVRSKSGKALLLKRGEHLERSFCHVLDHGGLRRATLRGEDNLTKRQLGAALTYNLSLLMRHLTGTGTPKQWLAAVGRALAGVFGRLAALITIWRAQVELLDRTMNHWFSNSLEKRKSHKKFPQLNLSRFSTGY